MTKRLFCGESQALLFLDGCCDSVVTVQPCCGGVVIGFVEFIGFIGLLEVVGFVRLNDSLGYQAKRIP